MAYSVRHDAEEKMIIAEVKGRTDLHDLREMSTEIIRIAMREKYLHILTDLREADLDVTVLELYYLPKDLTEIARTLGLDIYDSRWAFVAAEGQELLRFYETVSKNQGHSTRLFYDIEEARNWLGEYIRGLGEKLL